MPIRKLYRKISALAHNPYSTWWLFGVSFVESSFFPIPPDTMLAPMVLTHPKKAWTFAAVCTAGSVAGGPVGYAIGAWLYSSVGHWLINFYGMSQQLDAFREMYRHYGAAIILLKGFTPIPYKLVTIASGLAGYPVLPFIILSAITRGGRFSLVTFLLVRYGDSIREQMEKHMERMVIAFFGVIVLGFALAHFLLK
jgi:membrane protein YqaA with SNARE-associated domain